MSVMDRLKAIRGRLSAADDMEAAAPKDGASPPAEDAAPSAAPRQAPGGGPAPTNMWDMVVEPDPADEVPLAVRDEPPAPAPKLVPFPAPVSASPAFQEADPAPAQRAWPGEAAWSPHSAPQATSTPAAAPASARSSAPAWPPQPVPPAARADDARRAGRVKTRLLGFDHSTGESTDFDSPSAAARPAAVMFPVGWLVITAGPGRGASFALAGGVSQIGRGEDQAVRLDFGDTTISRAGHAAIAYDDETRSFFVGHGGKSNLVRLNGKPLLSTETLKHGDHVQIGETTLRLVALCGEAFSWAKDANASGKVSG